MIRSGLVLLALFVGAILAERYLAQQRALPFATVHAIVLALGVTLTIGSLQGVAAAWRQRTPTAATPFAWRDGEQVRVEGTLRLRGRAVKAPFSARDAVYLEYGAWTPRHASEVSVSQRAHWRGFVAVPVDLEMDAGRIALVGMPPARCWPEDQFTANEYHSPAARHVAATAWTEAPDVIALDPGAAVAAFAGTGESGAEQHLMNSEATEALGLRRGTPATVETLQHALGARPWTFTERIVPPDAKVTVAGTYRSTPSRLEVALSIRHADHAVYLGAAAPRAEAHWRTTLTFALVLAALTIAAHLLVYGAGSVWYRSLLASAG